MSDRIPTNTFINLLDPAQGEHMLAPEADANSRVAYRKPQPAEMAPDLLVVPSAAGRGGICR